MSQCTLSMRNSKQWNEGGLVGVRPLLFHESILTTTQAVLPPAVLLAVPQDWAHYLSSTKTNSVVLDNPGTFHPALGCARSKRTCRRFPSPISENPLGGGARLSSPRWSVGCCLSMPEHRTLRPAGGCNWSASERSRSNSHCHPGVDHTFRETGNNALRSGR